MIVLPVAPACWTSFLASAMFWRQHRRGVVGGGEHRLAVAERARVGQPPRHQRRALVDRVDDGLPVQRQRQRPAHPHVTQHALEAGHDERVGGPARALVDLDRAAVLQLVQGGQPEVVGPLDRAGQHARGEGRDVRDALEGDLVDQRVDRRVPVVRVADRDHAHARVPGVVYRALGDFAMAWCGSEAALLALPEPLQAVDGGAWAQAYRAVGTRSTRISGGCATNSP